MYEDDEPSEDLPVGALVQFEGKFVRAGQPYDPKGVTATVSPPRGSTEIYNQRTGVVRDGDGSYHIQCTVNYPGRYIVRFTTDEGDYQMKNFDVVDENAQQDVDAPIAPIFTPRSMPVAQQSARRDAWRQPLSNADAKK